MISGYEASTGFLTGALGDVMKYTGLIYGISQLPEESMEGVMVAGFLYVVGGFIKTVSHDLFDQANQETILKELSDLERKLK